MSSMGQKDMAAHDMMNKNPSMHTMPATVNSVDTKTGIVDVTAGGMSLKVHFPPPSVVDLKSGVQTTVHMVSARNSPARAWSNSERSLRIRHIGQGSRVERTRLEG